MKSSLLDNKVAPKHANIRRKVYVCVCAYVLVCMYMCACVCIHMLYVCVFGEGVPIDNVCSIQIIVLAN